MKEHSKQTVPETDRIIPNAPSKPRKITTDSAEPIKRKTPTSPFKIH